MKVDEKATRAARKRQRAAIKRLDEMFGFTRLHLMIALHRPQTGKNPPMRTRPKVPILRPVGVKQKRRKRKIAHESRRRNRR